MACGAGLFVLAIATMIIHFAVMLGFPIIAARLPQRGKLQSEIHIDYSDGHGTLRTILIRCTELKFAVDHVRLDHGRSMSEVHQVALDLADHEATEHLSAQRAPSLSTRQRHVSGVGADRSAKRYLGGHEIALEDRESVLD